MSLLFKVFLLVLGVGILAISCRRKPETNTLSSWLSRNYPEKFRIVNSWTADPIRQLSFKVKKSIVAAVDDPLLQIEIEWDKRQDNLGLTSTMVDSMVAKAERDIAQARALRDTLNASGLMHVATGVYRGTAHILLFDKPTPDHREALLTTVKRCAASWDGKSVYDLHVAFYDSRDSNYADIYPVDYWATPGTGYLKYVTYMCSVQTPYDWDTKSNSELWEFNTYGDRFSAYSEDVRKQITKWSTEHLDTAIALTPLAEFEQDPRFANQFRFKFAFVYGSEEASESASTEQNAGFISGTFNVDTEQLDRIQVTYNTQL